MENNDLAIILPHLGQDALYRVLSSLTLQSDKRFAVYGFYLAGETGVRALLDDYADHLDLVPCEVEAYPSADAPFSEQALFFLGRLGGERFVTFSDGSTLYDRDCVRAFHARAWAADAGEIFRWRTGGSVPSVCSYARFARTILLGRGVLPSASVVFRRSALEYHLAERDYFSIYQLLTDLVYPMGLFGLDARVSVGREQEHLPVAEHCSVIEWAEERFGGHIPVPRIVRLWRAADIFTDLVPGVPMEEIRQRYLSLRMAQGKWRPVAAVVFVLSSWGL